MLQCLDILRQWSHYLDCILILKPLKTNSVTEIVGWEYLYGQHFFYAAHRSRPSDGHGSRTAFYFLGWLHQHARKTTASRQNIIQERAIDAFLFPDLRTDLRHEEDVCQRNKSGQSTEQATVSDRLGVLASRVAMTEVGNEACATIIKTTEQSVRPLSCHGESNWIKFSEKRSLRYRSWTDE